MAAFRAIALVGCLLAAGCNQLLGIEDPPDDGVPAISGTYLAGLDFRSNTALGVVVLAEAHVLYSRGEGEVTIELQPLTAAERAPIGESWSTTAAVTAGTNITYLSTTITGTVPQSASPGHMPFSIEGEIVGRFKDETAFCGVLTGTYWTTDKSAFMQLPSIAFGAVKTALTTPTVEINCSGDKYTP